jgi:hypothetical protein
VLSALFLSVMQARAPLLTIPLCQFFPVAQILSKNWILRSQELLNPGCIRGVFQVYSCSATLHKHFRIPEDMQIPK